MLPGTWQGLKKVPKRGPAARGCYCCSVGWGIHSGQQGRWQHPDPGGNNDWVGLDDRVWEGHLQREMQKRTSEGVLWY